jgi:glycosyltransferase involved in cell wall biosynthesis
MASIVRRKHCFLSRNALGYAHLNNQEISDRSGRSSAARFILFYGSGSRSHNENFALMAKSLADLLRRNPQIQLRIVGPVEISSALAKVQNQIERIPFTEKVSDYWRQLATANVNLAPLTSNAFNDAKSEIKWMEAAILGIPSIVSSSAVYDELIRHGKDGFIAKTEEDWGEIIDRLLVTPGLASSVGANARERVFADYDLRAGGANLLAILKRGRDEKLDEERRIAPRKEPLILVVNIFFPPEFIGGATRVVEQTINDVLSKSRDMFSIEVFCGRDPDGSPGMIERYEWNGVPVTSLSPFGDVDSIERSVETESLFATYLDMLGPDLIHFHCIQRLGASLLDVALAKGIPYVVSAHDGWWISDHQFLIDQAGVPVYESGTWGDVRRLERLKSVLNRGRATIAVSQSQARLYSSRGINNVITIANGSETLAEVDAAPSEGPVWLGLLGGLGLPKGSLLLEEALRRRRYANLRFLVVDHSMPEGDVRHALWGSNEVELVGKTSFASVAKIYSRIHALLAISVCVESFGLVAREAQRLGRWVIGSDRGGMAEDINEGEDGFVVDPSRVDDLIRVLDTIDAHPERYRLPPRKIKQLRGREEVAMELIKLYRSILEVPESEM